MTSSSLLNPFKYLKTVTDIHTPIMFLFSSTFYLCLNIVANFRNRKNVNRFNSFILFHDTMKV